MTPLWFAKTGTVTDFITKMARVVGRGGEGETKHCTEAKGMK